MLINTEIHPNRGFGSVTFSSTCDEVKEYLGLPEYIDKDDRELTFLYSDLGVNIIFVLHKQQFVISAIEFEKEFYTLWNSPVIGRNYDYIKLLLERNNCKGYRIEKDCYGHYIFCEEIGLDFEFEKGIVTAICLNNRRQS